MLLVDCCWDCVGLGDCWFVCYDDWYGVYVKFFDRLVWCFVVVFELVVLGVVVCVSKILVCDCLFVWFIYVLWLCCIGSWILWVLCILVGCLCCIDLFW